MAEKQNSKKSSLLEIVQALLTIIVSLSAFFSALGFMIVNTSLIRYTDIPVYNISPAKFISAGVYAAAVLSIFVVPILLLAKQTYWSKFNTEWMTQRWFKVILLYSTVIMLFLAFIGFYGLFVYPTFAPAVGGGKPATVQLVFKEELSPEILGLTVDTLQKNKSGPVLLLTELTDGILVRDETNANVVVVKNELIMGFIDSSRTQHAITSAPQVTLTHTVLITPTP